MFTLAAFRACRACCSAARCRCARCCASLFACSCALSVSARTESSALLVRVRIESSFQVLLYGVALALRMPVCSWAAGYVPAQREVAEGVAP